MCVKKFFFVLLLVINSVFLASTVLLSQSAIDVSLPDTSSYPDTVIEVPIYVADVTGGGIYALGIKISFDSKMLEAVGAETGGTLTSLWGAPTFNSDSTTAVIGIAGTTALTGNGKLIKILLRVIGSPGDTTKIHFEEFIFNEGSPAARTKDGILRVVKKTKKAELFVSPTVLNFGTAKDTMHFSISNIGEDTLFWSIANTSNWITDIDPSSGINDTIVTVFVNRKELQPGDYSSNLVINSNGGSGQVTVKLSVAAVEKVMVAFPDTTLSAPGQIINIPVVVADVTGENIYSMGMKMIFNSRVLEFMNVVTDSSLCSKWSAPVLSQDSGKVTIGIAGTVPLVGRGNLFYMRFRAIGSIGDTSRLHFVDFFFNEGSPKTIVRDGFLKIVASSSVKSDFGFNYPKEIFLEQNYPNPFNSSTAIGFEIQRSSYVSLNVFDIMGNLVKQLAKGRYASGKYYFHWNGINKKGESVPSGVYFYKLKTNSKSIVKKMILLR